MIFQFNWNYYLMCEMFASLQSKFGWFDLWAWIFRVPMGANIWDMFRSTQIKRKCCTFNIWHSTQHSRCLYKSIKFGKCGVLSIHKEENRTMLSLSLLSSKIMVFMKFLLTYCLRLVGKMVVLLKRIPVLTLQNLHKLKTLHKGPFQSHFLWPPYHP